MAFRAGHQGVGWPAQTSDSYFPVPHFPVSGFCQQENVGQKNIFRVVISVRFTREPMKTEPELLRADFGLTIERQFKVD